MKCPACGTEDVYVVDSRSRETYIRRRRKCVRCGKSWYTREVDERVLLDIVSSAAKLQ